MSSETRTLFVILALCAFVALMCVVVPIGIGAVLYFRVQQQQVAVQAEFNQAFAQQQRMQEEAASRQARLQQKIESQMNGLPPIDIAPSDFGPGGAPLGFPPPPFPPPVFPGEAPPGLSDTPVADPTLPSEAQRRNIYRAIKTLQQVEEQFAGLIAATPDDPNMQQAAAQMKAEKEKALRQLATQANITPAQLDEIVVEGDKAGW
jgi:hypothetical protein